MKGLSGQQQVRRQMSLDRNRGDTYSDSCRSVPTLHIWSRPMLNSAVLAHNPEAQVTNPAPRYQVVAVQRPLPIMEGAFCVSDSFAPGGGAAERSGHRALDCRGSGYFLIVFGFGPVTWVRPARV